MTPFKRKQAQICAEGCEGENFTHIDTGKESIYSLMVNILQILSKCFTNMKNHYGNLNPITPGVSDQRLLPGGGSLGPEAIFS